jgi:hypothetical protein
MNSWACIQNNYVKNSCSTYGVDLFASRLFPWIQCGSHEKGWDFQKESTLFEKPVPFSWIPHCIQGRSQLFESTCKKDDSLGATGIFHLIILNTSSVNRLCGIVFNRFYRLEIHSLVVGIFGPACELLPPWTKELYLCTVAPLYSLWPPPSPLPKVMYSMYSLWPVETTFRDWCL